MDGLFEDIKYMVRWATHSSEKLAAGWAMYLQD